MPIYEFRCNTCQKKSSVFVQSINSPLDPVCPYCKGRDMVRLISGFAYHKSEKTRLEESGPPRIMADPDYYKDPLNVGRWAESRLKELGVDMNSQEYRDTFAPVHEMIGRAREGDTSFLDERGVENK